MDSSWPKQSRENRPWTRWWWHGSAVDEENISYLLEEYARAGLGGVEITPIYGVKGMEEASVPYMSPRWLELLRHTLCEASRLGLGVDLSVCTGWPIGGPNVEEYNSLDRFSLQRVEFKDGEQVVWHFGQDEIPQVLIAFSPNGGYHDLTGMLDPDNSLTWKPEPGQWILYSLTIKWGGRSVKRAAPGGEGRCINPFSVQAVDRYFDWFEKKLEGIPKGAITCQFHDSFEYLANWTTDFLEQFIRRRGYDLAEHLPAFAGDLDTENFARIRTDYRETISELLLVNFSTNWKRRAHSMGSLTRNQAHGSPGNWLDLYAAADIPETEIFGDIGNPLVSKFASSAAHLAGRKYTSAETCTWLGEHFNVTLRQAKEAVDMLLVAGIDRIFYHGTAYSPKDAAWPGWVFYATTTFSPQDILWHDFPALNSYIANCQSVLQEGVSDNDILVYWPLHDLWQNRPELFTLEISGKWLTDEPVGKVANLLWMRGYCFDYVSDKQLQDRNDTGCALGYSEALGSYSILVVPPCKYMPLETLAAIISRLEQGAVVIFVEALPVDVPGLFDLERRRAEFHKLLARFEWKGPDDFGNMRAQLWAGRAFVGKNVEDMLISLGARRETVADLLKCSPLRLKDGESVNYFLLNRSGQEVDAWVRLATDREWAILMDPLTGKTGRAASALTSDRLRTGFRLQLPPGGSLIARMYENHEGLEVSWQCERQTTKSVVLGGTWHMEFLEGGPAIPKSLHTDTLKLWTELGDPETEYFAGTCRYSVTFDISRWSPSAYRLDLGVVHESARVYLNGEHLATLITAPYSVRIPSLSEGSYLLEIEVTNVSANRIRYMDIAGQEWKIFRDINVVGKDYKPLDASEWGIRPSGLQGPVTLMRLVEVAPYY